jgi:hypothetical protein
MDKVDDIVVSRVSEVVSEKAVELVESKAEEIGDKVGSVADKELDKLEEKIKDFSNTIETHIKELEAVKKIEDIIDKIDDDPRVKAAIDTVTDAVGDQFDGREFSCGCFGWGLSLKISRKSRVKSPSTPLVIDNKLPELPSLPEVAKESLPPKTPSESQSVDPVEQTSAST